MGFSKGLRKDRTLKAPAKGRIPGDVERSKADVDATAYHDTVSSTTFLSAIALQAAAAGGNVRKVKKILAKGTVTSPTGYIYSHHLWAALEAAAENGHREVVERLLAAVIKSTSPIYSPDNIRLHLGMTLLAATRGGHLEVTRRLLAVELNTTMDTPITTKDMNIAMQVAAESGHFELVETLLAAGAKLNAATSFNKNVGRPATINGSTVLHAAAKGGHVEVVDFLLAVGADVNTAVTIDNGRTALQAATGAGHLEVVRRLLTAGADIEAFDVWGRTILQTAAEAGHLDILEMLLAAGADINTAIQDKAQTALQAAAKNGHYYVVDKLLEAGAKVNATGYFHLTALQAAAEGGHLNVVERLLSAEADVDYRTRGKTALQFAERGGHLDVAKRLQAAKANVNAPVGISQEPANKEDRTIKRTSFSRGLQSRYPKLLEVVWMWLSRPTVQSGYRRLEWQCVSLLTGGRYLSSYTKNAI